MIFISNLTKQSLLVWRLLGRNPGGYSEAKLLAGGGLGDQPKIKNHYGLLPLPYCSVPVKIGGHRDEVIPNNETGGQELIGDPISRVLSRATSSCKQVLTA